MTESAPTDTAAQILALRSQGAERFDPVGLHYLEALLRRAQTQQGTARHILDGKLERALAAYTQQLEQKQSATNGTCAAPAASPGPLHALVQHLAQHIPDHGGAQITEPPGARTELKSVRYFRGTWSRLSADRQVTHALNQAPKNAGPINSHMVVLRSLALMRDIAPGYLNHFMTYVDTLLCLDEVEKAPLPSARAAAGTGTGASEKKPRAPRARPRPSGTAS
jgi:hypothetical protein